MAWGPLVGGTGVRERHSLPSVEFSFGDLPPLANHGAKLADMLAAFMEKGGLDDDAVRASTSHALLAVEAPARGGRAERVYGGGVALSRQVHLRLSGSLTTRSRV
jgi:hypothetical protein